MIDILVLGATGFTGRLVARYLNTHHDHGSRFTFAVGARSQSKLDDLVAELSLDDTVEVILVDVTIPEQVDAAVKRAKVVINTVGPFMRWGTPVVAACVKNGLHYVDVTPETHWVRDIIDKYDYAATEAGSIVLPCAGFDSAPSDICVYLANKTLKAVAGPDTAIENSTSAWDANIAASGGSLNTFFYVLEELPRAKLEASMRDHILSPVEGVPQPRPQLLYTLPMSSPLVRGSFYVGAGINRAIVQRTWGLHELEARRLSMKANTNDVNKLNAEAGRKLRYGQQFKYDEFIIMPNAASAVLSSISVMVAFIALGYISPLRWLLKKLVTQPGKGPPDQILENDSFKVTNITSSVPTTTTPCTHVKTCVHVKGDPYLATAMTSAESALALLFESERLPALASKGGILTPMSALGDVLIERLKDTGRFEFTSEII